MNRTWLILTTVFWGITAPASAAPLLDPLHGDVGIEQNASPPPMAPERNRDVRVQRSYPMQPPVVPHAISSYAIDLNSNKCLSCHDRDKAVEKQAPMVSVTHYMDRDGQFLAEVSPRRYFCTQCHVAQDEVPLPVDNTFVDTGTLLRNGAGKGTAP